VSSSPASRSNHTGRPPARHRARTRPGTPRWSPARRPTGPRRGPPDRRGGRPGPRGFPPRTGCTRSVRGGRPPCRSCSPAQDTPMGYVSGAMGPASTRRRPGRAGTRRRTRRIGISAR
jgi:hypothetical protein